MMQNYLIDNVQELKNFSSNVTALVVHKLHRTPYHIGILYNGNYFALTIEGITCISQSDCFIELENKTNNNLLIVLKDTNNILDCKPYFENQSLNSTTLVSCLFPIREFLSKLYANNKFESANNLFELLDYLNDSNLIVQTYATRLTPIMENKIVLMRYDEELIKKHIKKLLDLK